MKYFYLYIDYLPYDIDRWTERQIGRQTDRQKDRKTDR